MRLNLTADTRRAVERLVDSATRAGDLRGAQDRLLDVLRGASERQFATGAGWVHSEKAGQTLVLSGDLRDSFTRAGGNSRVRVTDDAIEIESLVDYAGYLADGARGMPRRDPSDIDGWRAERDAADVFADYIAGEIR